ncbi:nickel pincer cofactor biosynthesis protein LarC [cf. Phormidesmis sp. LEGE 11477]|uniref:nickel pincer cofactor biosynthesis protein LarC n=1 Tax=cf. Phormidesmis sp. LEGE 11477 TaxID=1828680 RepID=UPI00187E5114|nr:nickel pincer cofactor biosynthesis protein LarC [cf. Phormidesmis sp. LEGE 11477]MBE9061750.1 nickel pincer cofactor biosynthesis protein LarC [cf. Phormidesmis sp. LEGE 11477]
MKTLAYLDCPTGIAGDMCLGALVHAGVPTDYLKEQFAMLGIDDEFELRFESVLRNQQTATKIHIELTKANLSTEHHHHSGRKLPEINELIQQAGLPERVTQWSLAVFSKLAAAEASVHGIAPEQVHFHEVGATDAVIDVVGTCLGLDWLGIDRLICSPLPTGGGRVRCEHGLLPVPAPAVLEMMMMASVPVYSNGIEKELVTPTGCAIATTLSESFGPPPSFTLQKVGLGAGGRDLPIPNILRLWIGTVDESSSDRFSQPLHVHRSHVHQSYAYEDDAKKKD